MSYSPTIQLAQELLKHDSVSPDRSSTQEIIAARLQKLGFQVEHHQFHGANNFWARIGSKSPLFVFSGHSDVVPAGDETQWGLPPFEAKISEEFLYGRGAADMKGSIAAMVTATEEFLAEQKSALPFSIGFLITGDEELGGPSAKSFLDYLYQRGEKIDYCLVGEPTSENQLGDTYKIGRRGSLTGTMKIYGKQGHVGYPNNADNALHNCFAPLHSLASTKWDDGSPEFQPTTFQIVKLNSGIADNIIPGETTIKFNFRFSSASSSQQLQAKVEQILLGFPKLNYEISWQLFAEPFITKTSHLSALLESAIKNQLQISPGKSTSGGISDARFFAEKKIEVIEFGPLNKTIHQFNEHVGVIDLNKLSKVYLQVLQQIC